MGMGDGNGSQYASRTKDTGILGEVSEDNDVSNNII